MGLSLCTDTVGQRNNLSIYMTGEEEQKSDPPAKLSLWKQESSESNLGKRKTWPLPSKRYFDDLVERRCGSAKVHTTHSSIFSKLLSKRAAQVENMNSKSARVTSKSSAMADLAREIAGG